MEKWCVYYEVQTESSSASVLGTGTGFSSTTSAFPLFQLSTSIFFIILIRRTSGRCFGTIKRNAAVLDMAEHRKEMSADSYFHMVLFSKKQRVNSETSFKLAKWDCKCPLFLYDRLMCKSKPSQLKTLLALSFTYLFCQQSVRTVLQETFVPATEQKRHKINHCFPHSKGLSPCQKQTCWCSGKKVIYCKNHTEIWTHCVGKI